MANFVNISGNDRQQLLVNKDDISVVVERIATDPGSEKGVTLSFSSFDAPVVANMDTQYYSTDTDAVIRALVKNGTPLFEFPFIWGDGRALGRFFVNPSAFNYVTVSKPYTPKGKTEPHVAMILGVDGYGQMESSAVLPEDAEKFLDAVRQHKPEIKIIDPSVAKARFYECSFAAYDPEKVIRVYQNGHQVNVRFASGGLLDFNMPNRDWVGEYIDTLNRASKERKRQFFVNRKAKGTLNEIVYGFEKRIKARVQREFARMVAADAPQLTRIERTMGPLYLRFNNVAYVSLQEYESSMPSGQEKAVLSFEFKRGTADERGMGGGCITGYFRSFADAEQALQKLRDLPSAAPKPSR